MPPFLSRPLLAIVFAGLISTLFVLANSPELQFGSFIFVGIAAIILVTLFTKPELLGFIPPSDLLFQTIIGIVFGAVWILASQSTSLFNLGVPSIPASLASFNKFLLIAIVAPILEEFLFRGFIRLFLFKVLSQSSLLSNVIQAALFSAFHANVFGDFYTGSGNFIGAFLFGLAAGFLSDLASRISHGRTINPLPGIIGHVMFNSYAIRGTLALIS